MFNFKTSKIICFLIFINTIFPDFKVLTGKAFPNNLFGIVVDKDFLLWMFVCTPSLKPHETISTKFVLWICKGQWLCAFKCCNLQCANELLAIGKSRHGYFTSKSLSYNLGWHFYVQHCHIFLMEIFPYKKLYEKLCCN